MDPVTTFFLALGKFLDLQILIFTALPAASKEAGAQRLFETGTRIQGFLDRGAARIGLGPLADDKVPKPGDGKG
jgi:hypothetical protein